MSIKRLQIKDRHNWKCKPGNQLCVLDRGAARFEFPDSWVLEVKDGTVTLHDRPAGIEACDLCVSILNVPGLAVNELALDDLLVRSLDSNRQVTGQSEIYRRDSGGVEIAWLEQKYFEETQQRPAKFRVALARSPELHCLISLNYWAERAGSLERVWDEVLDTLVLAVYVQDPTVGPVVN